MMNKETKISIWVMVVMAIFSVGLIFYYAKNPSDSTPECTVEYVQQYGSEECSHQSQNAEAESDAILEQYFGW